LNGVQEVAGSIPVTQTSEKPLVWWITTSKRFFY